MKRLPLLAGVALALLLPAAAHAQRPRLLRGTAGSPSTFSGVFGVNTPPGYGALDTGYAGVGTLTIVGGTQKDGNGTATSVFAVGLASDSAQVANKIVPAGTYVVSDGGTLTHPLQSVAFPVTMDVTDGTVTIHGTITSLANTWSFTSDDRDGVVAFQLRKAYESASLGDILQQRCGAGNPNALLQGGFAESIPAHGVDGGWTGSNYIVWKPDSPNCATWTNIRFAFADAMYLDINGINFNFNAYTGGWAQDGTRNVSSTGAMDARGISYLKVENSSFTSNTSTTVCGGTVLPTCVDPSADGNIYSAIMAFSSNGTRAGRGTNVIIANNSFNGTFRPIALDADASLVTGNLIQNFFEDAIHSECLTSSDVTWNKIWNRQESGSHGDWLQITTTECNATETGGNIIGNQVYDGQPYVSPQGEGNGFPFTGGGVGPYDTLWSGWVFRGNFLSFNYKNSMAIRNWQNFDVSYNTIVEDQGGVITPSDTPVIHLAGSAATGGTIKCNALPTTTLYTNDSGSTQTPTTTTNVSLTTGQYSTAFGGPIWGSTAAAASVATMQAAFAYKSGGPLDTSTTGFGCYAGSSPYFNYTTRTRTDPP